MATGNATTAVEVPRLDLAEALIATGHSSLRRARLLAAFAADVVSGKKRLAPASRELLDGWESDLEELTLRWRLAGVRWPIVILLAVTFLAGINAGRRGR